MRKLALLLLCILFITTVSAQQGDRLVDSTGNLVYQYNRSVSWLETGKCKVTVTFINGYKQLGVSFRQEVFRSKLQWVETDRGDTTQMPNIKVITANMAPNETLVWSFIYRNKSGKKDRSVDLEKSCFMLLDEEYRVTKKVLPETVVKAN